MKTSISIKIVIWACNIALFLLVISFFAGTYFFAKLPSIVTTDVDLSGVERSSYRASQSFLGDSYQYERVIDREKGIDEENYYFSSNRNLYRVSFSDSLAMQADKVNRELSSTESRYFGLLQKSTTVTESTDDMLVRYAAPAVPVSKESFISYARAHAISLLLVILYGAVFLWYLRKFIAGLRVPGFFTQTNALYLKITAWMAIAAPFLVWAWNTLFRPDLFADYRFKNATEVSAGLSLPLLMLLFGVVLLAIAWSFDHGVKLQKEQELTI